MTDKDKVARALNIAFRFGQIDGDHHKAWCIDQMVRELTRSGYTKWVEDYSIDTETGEHYEWNEGIAP